MTPKRAIVTVGISEGWRLFGPYLDRFLATFGEHGGADYLKAWHREWPPGSPSHFDCHYGFKVHAVEEAFRRGYTSVLWFDVACHATGSLAPLWERLEREGHLLIEDANALGNWSSDKALEHFGVSRDEAMGIHLMCGSGFGLDLRSERSRAFLARLKEFAVPEHFNGTHESHALGRKLGKGKVSSDERVRGHRSDEVYMSLVARELGMATRPDDVFSGDSPFSCVRGGYDISTEGGVPNTYDEGHPRKARKLEVIAEHTIDTALLRGGLVLDAGCRDFRFASALVERGCKVVSLDADPTIVDPMIHGVAFVNLALADEPGTRSLLMHANPEARCLAPAGVHVQMEQHEVQAVTLAQLSANLGVERWDVVKLDVEGAEVGILMNWPGPIATQISVEFHEHCGIFPDYDAIMRHLGQWYEVVRHERDARYCAGFNHWDSLWCLK